jgi:hypothetical protein
MQGVTTDDTATQESRTVAKIVRGMKTSDGAGVKLTRVIGTPLLRNLDPFLMLDEFKSDEPQDYLAGFPDHPHRGFETVTYMLAGTFRHRDNHGHEGLLRAGGAQWMTAGRGIIHSEMPEQERGLVRGFQLWLNLPAKDKMCAPSYRDLQPEDVPRASLDGGVEARLLAGRAFGIEGPTSGRETDPLYADVSLPQGTSVVVPVPSGHAGFVYAIDGDVVVGEGDGERKLAEGELGVMTDGDRVRVRAAGVDARVLVIAGKPLREPIVQHGPFVMNTRAEIEQAIRDYQAGRF